MAELDIAGAVAQLLAGAGEAIHAYVQDVVAPLSDSLVPVATGALRDSRAISDPIVDANGVSVVLSYGNPADETGVYAIVVHERVDIAHATGQSKFLESAVTTAAPGFVAAIGR